MMVILFLTNNVNALSLYDWLKNNEEKVYLYDKKINLDYIQLIHPDMIISYNYNYLIRQDVISFMEGQIINLHISYLPWNRGFSPNLWSFIDNTPKGVTIHYIDEGLDTGDIIVQESYEFDPTKETFESTYIFLNEKIKELFISWWDRIRSGKVLAIKQEGIGSFHLEKQLIEIQKKYHLSWEEKISDFLIRYRRD